MLTPAALQAEFRKQAEYWGQSNNRPGLAYAADQLNPLIEVWTKMRTALNNLVAYSIGFLPSGCNALKAAEKVLRETEE